MQPVECFHWLQNFSRNQGRRQWKEKKKGVPIPIAPDSPFAGLACKK